jgi:hypothetical protein
MVLVALLTLPLTASALTGCAEQHAAAPPPSAATQPPVPTSMPTSSAPASPTPTPSGTAGLVRLTVHQGTPPAGVRRGPAWEPVSTPIATSTSVRIAWTDSPSPGCGAVRDVYVRETSSSVVIDLVRGTRTPGIMCPAILVPRRAEVPLPSALGSRVLQQDAASAGVQIAPAPTTAPTATAG